MTYPKIEQGTVTRVDSGRGVANVALGDRSAELHTAAFYSGAAARLPEVGDRVSVQVRGTVLVAAKLEER